MCKWNINGKSTTSQQLTIYNDVAESQPKEYLALFHIIDKQKTATHLNHSNNIHKQQCRFLCELSTYTGEETLCVLWQNVFKWHGFEFCAEIERTFSHPICNAGIAFHFWWQNVVIDITFQSVLSRLPFDQSVISQNTIPIQVKRQKNVLTYCWPRHTNVRPMCRQVPKNTERDKRKITFELILVDKRF